MELDTGAHRQGAGTVRRLWRQSVTLVPAPPPVAVSQSPATITRALRYRASTHYAPAGADNTRFGGIHSIRRPLTRQPVPTSSAGVRRAMPTVRNRIASFGQRVQPLNARIVADTTSASA